MEFLHLQDRNTARSQLDFCNETGCSHCDPYSCLPEAKDLRKILPFACRQGDVLLWRLSLHSCTVDLRKKGKGVI